MSCLSAWHSLLRYTHKVRMFRSMAMWETRKSPNNGSKPITLLKIRDYFTWISISLYLRFLEQPRRSVHRLHVVRGTASKYISVHYFQNSSNSLYVSIFQYFISVYYHFMPSLSVYSMLCSSPQHWLLCRTGSRGIRWNKKKFVFRHPRLTLIVQRRKSVVGGKMKFNDFIIRNECLFGAKVND